MSWIRNTVAKTGIRNTGLFHNDLEDTAQYIRSGHGVSDPTLILATAKKIQPNWAKKYNLFPLILVQLIRGENRKLQCFGL
jgi:hypothetical protein